MTTERLRDLHAAKPFRPFMICLADGQRIRATHPEALARSDQARTFVVLDCDNRAHHIDLLLVTDLIDDESSGPRRRRAS